MSRVFAAGLNYKSAPVALREKHAVAPTDQISAARHLRKQMGLSEVVLLWTCNRVEIYGVSEYPRRNLAGMIECLSGRRVDIGSGVYCHEGMDAVRHLFSVVSGLDSMVLGETEITNQVKSAYEKSREAGLTGRKLNRLFQKAFETAKEIRTTTSIGKGAASVGSVAVQHAQKIFGPSMAEKKILVIGAGAMAEKCLRHLVKRGSAGITVVNRSYDKAEELAKTYGGTAVSFGMCVPAMADMDVVITSTGCPHVILEQRDIETVMAGRAGRPLIIVDIAVPRDVDPRARSVSGVHLYDIDDLQATVRESISLREKDLALCWTLIGARAAELEPRLNAEACPPAAAAPAPLSGGIS
jgi:glutamyl-tRNA reductase